MSLVSSLQSFYKPAPQTTHRTDNTFLKYAYEPQRGDKKKTNQNVKRMVRHTKSFVCAVYEPNNKVTPETTRRNGNFHPSIWGDYFLKYAYDTQGVNNKAEQDMREKKKEEIRRMLSNTNFSIQWIINLIDAIQRLGIAYHFESEIGKILGHIDKLVTGEAESLHDLHTVSLIFRLLRQEGFDTSSDIFKQFIDEEGKFKDELHRDVQGMLSLYEAAHFLKHEEPILDEAISFTTAQLQSSVTSGDLSPFLNKQVKHALKQTIRRGMQRMEARRFISIYHEHPSHDELLLSFAKMDFNDVQKLHRKEIAIATMWYKDMDLMSKIPYARDRLVEVYMYGFGSHSDPKFSLSRVIMAKVNSLFSIIDDTYDTYGTIEELQAFTDAVYKWDIKCINQLPEYMKPIYEALLDVFEEIDKLTEGGGGSYRINITKNIKKRLVQAFFNEAKWFHTNHVPTVEEYMEVATVTAGCEYLGACFFLGMGDVATEKAFKWLWEFPDIVRSLAIIGRLMDDIVSHKLEMDRGHSALAIECYMKQYGATKEEAYAYFRVQIAEAWKDLNKEWLEQRDMPKHLLLPSINLACFVDALYKDESCYTEAGGVMKDTIKSLFIDPIPM